MAKSAAAALAPQSTYSEIELGGEFVLTSPTDKAKAKLTLPGDEPTALLDA